MSVDRLPLDPVEDEDQDSQQPSPSSQSIQSETYMVGFVIANIVGLQYYSGRISGREMVGLVREPLNRFDPNAIRVVNTRAIQVGHIEKKVASVLAPLIDSNLVHVEGIVPKTSKNSVHYKLPCHIHIFAKIEAFETVKSSFSRCGLCLISQNDPLFSTSESMVVKEKKKSDVDEIFKLVDESVSKNMVMGTMEPPKDLILPDLFLHQKEGLSWLYHRENSDELPPFWEERDDGFVNVLTNYQTDKRPEPLRGGIFADDMGLGKTLTLLSLIALDKCKISNNGTSEVMGIEDDHQSVVSIGKRSRTKTVSRSKKPKTDNTLLDERKKKELIGAKMTLIVCPPSVFSTWITQLTDHTKRGRLKAYMYYGERTQDVSELQNYDIILTTYSTLASELNNSNAPIKKIEWWRVILDEAHIIKNDRAKQSEAVSMLNAKRRWVVTGTPIQNGSMDLFSLMAFLRFDPFSTKSYWYSLVQRPIAQGNEKGLSRLQALMATISLRRTKDKTLIGVLPPKAIVICNVELSVDERKVYDQMESEAKTFIERYISVGSVTHNYSTILSIILRLRQICTHMELCPLDVRSSLSSYNFEDASNNPELLQKLVLLLQDGEDFDCPICLSPPTQIIITSCAHIFCQTCIIRTLNHSISVCPLCRRHLSESDLFSPPPEYATDPDQIGSSSSCQPSSKVAALLKLLEASRNENPSVKSVVFSQFRKLLLLLEEPLKAAGFKTLRLDGVMTAKRRAQVIEEFGVTKADGPTVLLASLKASGTGINLTAASRVYLMEPWWNPAVEEQAMDRVHRIGQTEEVKVVKMIARDSIDERIVLLQEQKHKLAEEAFRKKGKEEKRDINLADLRILMSL